MTPLLLGELRSRRAEVLLGSLAISLVVAALLVQRVVTASAEASIHDLAHRLGRNMLVLPASTDPTEFYRQRYAGAGLPEGTSEVIRGSPLAQHIKGIEARLYGNAIVNGVSAVIVGEDGRRPGPSAPGAQPAVLGAELARRLGVGIGARLAIGPTQLSVAAVSESPPDGLDNAVFLSLPAAQRLLGRPGEINALRLAGCWCRIDVATLAAQVERLIPGSRAVTVAGMLRAQQGSVAVMKRYSTVLHLAGAAFVGAVVAALVASLVRRRAREIGLLVAIGASPARVASVFAAVAALTGALGGVGGWLLAVPATSWLSGWLLGASTDPPSTALLLPAVGLTALGSAMVALIPAGRAAVVDPAVVLMEA